MDGSVGKMLVMQSWTPEFTFLVSMWKLNEVAHICNSEMGVGGRDRNSQVPGACFLASLANQCAPGSVNYPVSKEQGGEQWRKVICLLAFTHTCINMSEHSPPTHRRTQTFTYTTQKLYPIEKNFRNRYWKIIKSHTVNSNNYNL